MLSVSINIVVVINDYRHFIVDGVVQVCLVTMQYHSLKNDQLIHPGTPPPPPPPLGETLSWPHCDLTGSITSFTSMILFQDRALLADNARANFFRIGGDHLTLLNVYNEVCLIHVHIQ